jgi:hypothetical protein
MGRFNTVMCLLYSTKYGKGWKSKLDILPECLKELKNLKVVGNEKRGGFGKVANVCNMYQTMAIEVYLKFEHAFFEKNSFSACNSRINIRLL